MRTNARFSFSEVLTSRVPDAYHP
ncbi:hypothetical protein MIPYR_50224 [uncultured Microbacterium sp.]|uniref:Uncharacterized protein n=1 Tax=uncultured Microbacterium sp. TaxID=191216 RepID=A0A1Y5P650_9MICO|nr:hypothetical protein MIPYR_50224 [uncultured Microbacterium sp.]